MILLTLLRSIRSIWVEARQMQVDTIRRYPHLRGWN